MIWYITHTNIHKILNKTEISLVNIQFISASDFFLRLKGTFEITHKISYPYIERCEFYSHVNNQVVLDVRAKRFWTPTPPHHPNQPPPPTPLHHAASAYHAVVKMWFGLFVKQSAV